jgi:hypothetical protein
MDSLKSLTFQGLCNSVVPQQRGPDKRLATRDTGNILSDNELALSSPSRRRGAGPKRWGAVGCGEKVRVPNPDKPAKGRLDAPAIRVHKSKRKYRRRLKHPPRHDD